MDGGKTASGHVREERHEWGRPCFPMFALIEKRPGTWKRGGEDWWRPSYLGTSPLSQGTDRGAEQPSSFDRPDRVSQTAVRITTLSLVIITSAFYTI